MKKILFKGSSVVTISIIANLLLFSVKYIIGIQNQSLAIKADAWHTLSDSISSIIVMAGLWISNKPKSENHPYGFGRFEEITSIIVGIMLGYIGITFLRESIISLTYGITHVHYSLSSIIIMIVTIVTKEFMAQISIKTGKKETSRSLIADGWHHRSDAISSLVILIGIWLNRYIARIDSVLGLIVAVMIIYAALEIIKDTVRSMIGESIPQDIKKLIETAASDQTPQIKGLHNFKYHKYGRHIEITFHGYFRDDIKLKEAHDCVSLLESYLFKTSGLYCLIHPEVRSASE